MTVPIQTVLWSQADAARLLAPVRRLAVALLMLLALAQAMLPHGPASAQTMGGDLAWQVIEVSGDVRARQRGATDSWQAVTVGQTVSANTDIESGVDGRAVLAHEGSRITISQNSHLSLPGPVPPGEVYRVVQRVGTMLFKIVHATKDKFQVETPYLTTIIKGTTFSVSVNGAGGSVHVTEGAVLVRPLSGESAMVTPGQTARVPAASRNGVIINGRLGGASRNVRANAQDKAQGVAADATDAARGQRPDAVAPGQAGRGEKVGEGHARSAMAPRLDGQPGKSDDQPSTSATAGDGGASDSNVTGQAKPRAVAIIFADNASERARNKDLGALADRGSSQASDGDRQAVKSAAAGLSGDGAGRGGRGGGEGGTGSASGVGTSAGTATAPASVSNAGGAASLGAGGGAGGTGSGLGGSSGSGNAGVGGGGTPATAAGAGSLASIAANSGAVANVVQALAAAPNVGGGASSLVQAVKDLGGKGLALGLSNGNGNGNGLAYGKQK